MDGDRMKYEATKNDKLDHANIEDLAKKVMRAEQVDFHTWILAAGYMDLRRQIDDKNRNPILI